MTTVDVALMVLLLRVLVTTQVYTPEKFLVELSTVKTPTSMGTATPRGSRIWEVVISGIFLVIQVTFSVAPSLIVTSSNKGSLRTEEQTKTFNFNEHF